MGKSTRYPATVVLAVLFLLPGISTATTYRVGPGEEYAKVSEVADRLRAGDVVEITGDISDIFTLTANGTSEKPIVIRGVTRVENGQIIRPRITPPSVPCGNLITCKGDWTVLEGLDISGQTEGAYGNAAIIQACADFTIRNCRIHHNYRAINSLEESTGDTLVEFCEFDANGYAEKPPVAFYSIRPGAKLVVQHCYFHDGTGGSFLRICMPRAVVRYNWFENPYAHAVQISTPAFDSKPERITLGDVLLPYHADILGNVVVFGWGPGGAYCAFSLGGDSADAPGTEGDFNIAHNLVLTRRGGATPQVAVLVHGNVDRVNLFNNVILEGGVRGCMVYSREVVWDGTRREGFIKKRGNGEPLVAGANNWISNAATGVPEGFKETTFGLNPQFMDLVDYDFRPQPGSPLAGRGLWPLPEGKAGSLVPECEPRRGIPADLRPLARRRAEPPSAGPFEASETAPAFANDSADLVLDVRDSGGRFAWPFDFGGWRRRSLEYLYQGQPQEALACAKMEFLLCPKDTSTCDKVIRHVEEALIAMDGNDARAKAFGLYARTGSAGPDGKQGTGDDLADPLSTVGVGEVQEPKESFAQFDVEIDDRARVGSGSTAITRDAEQDWYATEKAFARIESAAFEEALPMLVPVLVRIVKQPLGDTDEDNRAWRNQSIMDRLLAALFVIGKCRTGSTLGADNYSRGMRDYARYGPVGADGVTGTGDDIDLSLLGLGSVGESAENGKERPSGEIAGLQARAAQIVAQCVESLTEAGKATIAKLEFIPVALARAELRGFLYASPTPAELFSGIYAKLGGGMVELDESSCGEEAEAACRILTSAVIEADKAVLDAFERVRTANSGHESMSCAEAYLAAYVAGVHDSATYPAVLELLRANVSNGAKPVFLVTNACGRLNDPFAAMSILGEIDRMEGEGWKDGEKEELLERIERAQHEAILSLRKRTEKTSKAQADALMRQLDGWCSAYLEYFPASSRADEALLHRIFSRYSLGDYARAAEDVDLMEKSFARSTVIPQALLYKGLALAGDGDMQAAVKVLDRVAQEYPKSSAAPKALYSAAVILISLRESNKAGTYLQRIVDYFPEDPCAAKARDLMKTLATEGR